MLRAYVYSSKKQLSEISEEFSKAGAEPKYIGILYKKQKDSFEPFDSGKSLIIATDSDINKHYYLYNLSIQDYDWKYFRMNDENSTTDLFLSGFKDWFYNDVVNYVIDLLQKLYDENHCKIYVPYDKKTKKSYGQCYILFNQNISDDIKKLYKIVLSNRPIDNEKYLNVKWKLNKPEKVFL